MSSTTIPGLSHITFITHDLAKMSRIYIEVLGGKKSTTAPPQTFPSRTKNSFMFGDIWVAAMEGESLPSRTYNHIAFKTDEAGLEKAKWAALNHTKA